MSAAALRTACRDLVDAANALERVVDEMHAAKRRGEDESTYRLDVLLYEEAARRSMADVTSAITAWRVKP